LAGVTVIELNAAALTVRTVDPLMDPEVAVMVVIPWDALKAKPVLLIGATVADEEVQVTVWVRSWFVPSAKFPAAVNCWLVPNGIETVAGATVIDTSTAVVVTLTLAVPLMTPTLAEMVAAPSATPVAKPWLPEASLTVATPPAEEAQ
jgi:hypothetical protein